MMWLENERQATEPSPTKSGCIFFTKRENVPVNPDLVTMDCLPTEAILAVFSFLLEQDLCRVSRVCKRFRAIANDPILWKRLYKSLFEYDTPLFTFGPCRYEFIPPEECQNTNPWRESFRQLYHGAHVRPGYEDKVAAGRNVLYFDTILTAVLSYEIKARAVRFTQIPVFIHAGVHMITSLPLSGETALIGAGPGNVAETVSLECATSSSIMFVESNKHAYMGHLSINFSPANETTRLLGRYLFKLDSTCEPLLDHLIIVNSTAEENSTLMLLCDTVELTSAWPIVKHCVVRNFENMGHTLIDSSLNEDERYQLTTFGFKPGLPSIAHMVRSCGNTEDLMLSVIRCPWVQCNLRFKNSLNPCSEIPRYLLQMQRAENTT